MSDDSLAAGLEDYHLSEEEAAKLTMVKARLTVFDGYRDELLAVLQKECKRTKAFDKEGSWRTLRFCAWSYLEAEAAVKQKQRRVPARNRGKLLGQLGDALRDARSKIDEVMKHEVRGSLFLEWCELHGDPDLLEFLDLLSHRFDKVAGDVIAGLADLEVAAFRAAEEQRQRQGRPGGTSVLPHDFLIRLEYAYRSITGKPGGAGRGPFARFVAKFLKALKRTMELDSIVGVIKEANKLPGWGRLLFTIRGKTPPSSP